MRTCSLSFGVLAVLNIGPAAVPVQAAPAQAARVVEPAGRFSYAAPAGWHVRVIMQAKYKACFAPQVNGFSANIVGSDDVNPAPLDAYSQASILGIKRSYTAVRVISEMPFVTSSGVHGRRLAIVGIPTKMHLRQNIYLFPAPSNRKIILVVSWLTSQGEKYASTADQAMKTFNLQ